ncbi:doublecortin domain-containing protein 1 [Zonotrichia leucophrys gambelii]|uniref:doublecortin domain-containing protein 1 n=1 Tax=Zonotrichia leucophrys gambelii TaxID=257770 RepID=UPI0031403913
MIYAGYHCRQLATAYGTVRRKLVVVFQKIPASKWTQASGPSVIGEESISDSEWFFIVVSSKRKTKPVIVICVLWPSQLGQWHPEDESCFSSEILTQVLITFREAKQSFRPHFRKRDGCLNYEHFLAISKFTAAFRSKDFLCWASSGITIQNKGPFERILSTFAVTGNLRAARKRSCSSAFDRCLQNVIRPLCGPVWVFERKGFSLSGAEIYIQGVLLALHQRVNPAKCCKQPLQHLLKILSEDPKKTPQKPFSQVNASELRGATMGAAGLGLQAAQGGMGDAPLISIPVSSGAVGAGMPLCRAPVFGDKHCCGGDV